MAETKKKQAVFLIAACLAYAVIISFWSLSGEPLDDHKYLVSVTAGEMLNPHISQCFEK